MVEGRDSDLHEQLEWGTEEKGSLRKTCWAHFHAPKSCKWKLDLTMWWDSMQSQYGFQGIGATGQGITQL